MSDKTNEELKNKIIDVCREMELCHKTGDCESCKLNIVCEECDRFKTVIKVNLKVD